MANQYTLTNDFAEIAEEKGTLYNKGDSAIELASTADTEKGAGILLLTGERRTFSGTLYARSMDAAGLLNVADFNDGGEGGDNVLTYKGSVETYDDLPSTHNVGDVYNIETADETHGILAGDNVAWNGTSWDRLAGIYAIMQGATSSAAGKAGLAPAPAAGAETKVLFGDGTYKDISQVPLGAILTYSANANTPPPGFLYCEGQAISRTMYPDLFALIGTTYGAGDGSTTFNLPNMIGKYPQGDTTAGTVKAAGLPNITGDIDPFVPSTAAGGGSVTAVRDTYGAFSNRYPSFFSNYYSPAGSTSSSVKGGIVLDASLSNPIYGNSDTVTPPTLTVRWIIKAYDAPTPSSAQIDLSQYAADLAKRLTREMTPAFNKRDVITTSGTYTAPVTGWYRIVVKGGGGSGGSGLFTSASSYFGGCGGGEGGKTVGYEKMNAGDTASVVIGAGGAEVKYVSSAISGNDGGNSSVTVNNNTYTANGGAGGKSMGRGGAGGTGTIYGASGGLGQFISTYSTAAPGGTGGGNGGGPSCTAGINGGGGGGGSVLYTNTSYASGAGGDGFVWFEYFDPTLM